MARNNVEATFPIMATNDVEDTFPAMATNNVEALAEITQSLKDEEIVELIVFNGMVQIEDHWGIVNLDGMLQEYCRDANKIISFAKTQLETQNPPYELIDNMLDKLEVDSLRVAAKKVHMSVRPVRLCLTGDLEDLDVAKSALCTLERDNQMFESQIRKFIEMKKQVYLFDRATAAKSKPESSMQGEYASKKE
ncbi:unnamed protein product [Lactuca saligna]|uniref:Uncharacterized protein n=1 Tax=Lactuca saligna TaxID=75948 RepID=A0AA36E9E6_LACSI|nr:unnamed protein product [Lactuca saligna]